MVEIFVSNSSVKINDLLIRDEETVKVLNEIEEKDREDYILKSISIGSSVLRNTMTVEKIDYIEKEFQRLLTAFSKRTDEWDDQISETMEDSVTSMTESMDASLDLEKEGNPLYRLKKAIDDQIIGLRELIKKEEGKQEGKEEESAKGTMKGFDFEDEIVDNLNYWQHYPDAFEVIGDVSEGKSRRKVGDVLATLENGMTIVMEAKAGYSSYSDKGDKSLNSQMDESMAYRNSAGSIGITTIEAMERHGWQNSIFMDRGKNRFIVAVDRDRQDFTILRVAYILLRERIMSSAKGDDQSAKKTIDSSKVKEIVEDITRDMSSTTKMRQLLTNIEGKIYDVKKEIGVYQSKIQGRVDELNHLL